MGMNGWYGGIGKMFSGPKLQNPNQDPVSTVGQANKTAIQNQLTAEGLGASALLFGSAQTAPSTGGGQPIVPKLGPMMMGFGQGPQGTGQSFGLSSGQMISRIHGGV